MRSTFKVLFYLKCNAPKKDGLIPVMCRITINGKIAQFSCKLDVEEKSWNVELGRVSGRSIAAQEANRMLDKIRVGINQAYQKIADRDNYVTAEKVRNAYLGLGMNHETLLAVFRQHNEDYGKQVGKLKSPRSYWKYCTMYKHPNEASEQWSVQDIENNKEQASRNSEKQEIKGDKNRKTRDRGALVPKSLNLHISNPKINKIFEELKHVQVKTCPNASSVLLRVFLELSVDAYLEKFDLVRNNAITACSSGESLQGKVGKVLNHMTQLGTMSNDLSKGIRSEINDKNSVLSIESLNAYVHNEFFYPKADNLITGWDNIESFFIQLWESIKNKE